MQTGEKTVFLSGSHRLETIPSVLIDKLDRSCRYIVGDAPGFDTLVIDYLYQNNFAFTICYDGKPRVRNDLPPAYYQQVGDIRVKREGQPTSKDRYMAIVADEAIFCIHSMNTGRTMRNIARLVNNYRKPLTICDQHDQLNDFQIKTFLAS